MAETPAHRKLARHMHSIGFRLLDQDEEDEGFRDRGEPIETLKATFEHLECGLSDFVWRHPDGRTQWALIIPGYGMAPDETVADFHVNGAIDEWFKTQ